MGILSLSRKRQPMRNRLLFEELYIDSYDLERCSDKDECGKSEQNLACREAEEEAGL